MCVPSESEIARAMEIAQTTEGQQLLDLLRADNSTQLQDAMTQAGTGDFSQLQQMLKHLLETPEADALVKKIRGSE